MIIQINKILQRLGKDRGGQYLSEYAVVIGIVSVALISMQFFMKRKVQAVIYDSVSEFGDPFFTEESIVMEPGRTIGSAYRTEAYSLTNKLGGAEAEQTIISQNTMRTGMLYREEMTE